MHVTWVLIRGIFNEKSKNVKSSSALAAGQQHPAKKWGDDEDPTWDWTLSQDSHTGHQPVSHQNPWESTSSLLSRNLHGYPEWLVKAYRESRKDVTFRLESMCFGNFLDKGKFSKSWVFYSMDGDTLRLTNPLESIAACSDADASF